MKNEISVRGLGCADDSQKVQSIIDEALVDGGCERQKFLFVNPTVKSCRRHSDKLIEILQITDIFVKVRVFIEG